MEPRFGYDFSGVRLHTGSEARTGASAVSARAYTVGNDIVLGAGEYPSQTSEGRHLLAHELTHVVQQRGGARPAGGMSAPGDAFERQADAVADAIAGGRSARPMLDSLRSSVVTAHPAPSVMRQPKHADPATSGHLAFDSNWSYIVYASEIRLRYFRNLPDEEANKRKQKNLPGFVQVGTIPWVTNNPGNITQTPGATPTTLQGLPTTLGSIGIYGGRYSIFSSEAAGVDAIGSYLSKLPSVGTNPNLSMASAIKQYKGEEPAEKVAREAREKENAERAKAGKPLLPRIDVREQYLADVRQRMQARLERDEAMEGGDDIDNMPASQRKQVTEDVKKRIDAFMSGHAADAPQSDDLLHAAVKSIHEVEGKAAAPGVTFSCGGFNDPTKTAAYDGEQKALIAKLIESEAAKKELQSLLGCP